MPEPETFIEHALRLERAIQRDTIDVRNAILSREEHRRELIALYDAHTAKPLETRTPCRPDCAVCLDALGVRAESSKPCPMLMTHNGDGSPTPGCTCKP